MIRVEIKKLIKKAIKLAQIGKTLPDFKIPEIHIEYPEQKGFGDYSTNVAMVVANKVRRKPMEVAEKIKNQISKIKNKKYFERVEVASPGFINFTLSESWLEHQVGEILKKGDDFGRGVATFTSRSNRGPGRYSIEFISANPTGPLHLGHGRGAFAGDTLANILKMAGFDVEQEYYINDAKKSGQIKALGKTVLGRSTVYLTDYLREKIKELSAGLSEEEAGYLIAQRIHKDIKKFITHKLKIKFDKWVSEEDIYQEGRVADVEKALREKGLLYEKEGALWLKTTKFGDDKDRVLIKKDGQPTYLLPDIAYHKDKFERQYQKVIDIWGADHLGHLKPLKIGLKTLGYDPQKLEILIIQMVRIKKEGKVYKMSKRRGETINLEWLIEKIGLDVVRFLYLMKTLNTQMEFDLDLAKERSEKNPVFYVQYAHARICSILRKVRRKNADKDAEITLKGSASNQRFNQRRFSGNKLAHSSELDLIRQLIRFPEMVEDTSKDYQVQRLPYYAMEISRHFHYFYKCCRVITEDKDLTRARLGLVLATKIVLKNVLGLMGISAPKKM